MKKILTFIFTVFTWFVLVNPVWAENFYIENYDVSLNVNKNKSVRITENIDVNFTTSSHGIYREIPFKNASISDISVSENYQTTNNPSKVIIKIGDPDKYITGKHHYTINYKYNYYDKKNEFYHNIIGTDWTVNINKASFKLTMPENVDPAKVGLSIGSYGTRGFDGGAWFKVDDNVISGATERELLPHEGITLRVEVPEGYFLKYTNFTGYWVVVGMLLLTLIAFLAWFIYGKDETAIPVVNFYPPKGLNAVEMELAFNGKASAKGLVALLIELAQKGYINIENNGKRFELHRQHNYDGTDKNEKDFLNSLFKEGTNSVSSNDLTVSQTFYRDCQDIINNVNKNRDKIFNPESIGFPLITLMFLCLTGLLFLTVFAMFNYNIDSIISNFPMILFPIIAIIVFVLAVVNRKSGILHTIFLAIWALGFGGMPLIALLSMCSNADIAVIIIGAIGLVITGICTYQLPKRSYIGQKLLNNLLGLKHFIEVAEKNRLQQLVNQDPEYFYNVLPAAYILGVSDKWINQFESIMQINPDWYEGERFNYHSFKDFSQKMQTVSLPSVENGGVSTSSSGGGGFSGGGGGGGGGGSW